ncbi:MAG: EF-Tu/IF-2/RF-3 family GTPase [Candidatus Nealsonbacteria bacterium]
MAKEEGQLIGKISHYFGNISVAVVDLSGTLKIGDTVRIVGGNTDFNQEVSSMEVDHKKVDSAKKGDSVGFKVSEKVRDDYRVYKI